MDSVLCVQQIAVTRGNQFYLKKMTAFNVPLAKRFAHQTHMSYLNDLWVGLMEMDLPRMNRRFLNVLMIY